MFFSFGLNIPVEQWDFFSFLWTLTSSYVTRMYPLSHRIHRLVVEQPCLLMSQLPTDLFFFSGIWDTELGSQKTCQRSCQPWLWDRISRYKINSKSRCSSIPVLTSFSQLDFTRERMWHECTHLNSNFCFSICPLSALTWRLKQNMARGELLTWGKGQSFPLELKKAALSHLVNLKHDHVPDHLDTLMVFESHCWAEVMPQL